MLYFDIIFNPSWEASSKNSPWGYVYLETFFVQRHKFWILCTLGLTDKVTWSYPILICPCGAHRPQLSLTAPCTHVAFSVSREASALTVASGTAAASHCWEWFPVPAAHRHPYLWRGWPSPVRHRPVGHSHSVAPMGTCLASSTPDRRIPDRRWGHIFVLLL